MFDEIQNNANEHSEQRMLLMKQIARIHQKTLTTRERDRTRENRLPSNHSQRNLCAAQITENVSAILTQSAE